jgi:hypothetical protein
MKEPVASPEILGQLAALFPGAGINRYAESHLNILFQLMNKLFHDDR